MKILSEINQLAADLQVEFQIPEIQIASGATNKLKEYIFANQWKKVAIIYDEHTYEAAGKQITEMIQDEAVTISGIMLVANENHQVIADEKSLVQVLIEISNDTDVLIAVGSGTIHDIVRFVGHKMNIPFISIPTAASVDGFTSKGAPLILRGVKQTIQTAAPVAVFADIDIIKAAPREMTAAGFGDILGKYTSLLDWKISELIGDEPYHEFAASLTRKALDTCVNYVEEISRADEKGIIILMNALIESGLVMQVLDYSRPASGAEHHLSHFWEMYLINTKQKQVLHGAKVGVATAIIVELYKGNWHRLLQSEKINRTSYREKLVAHHAYIQSLIDELPSGVAVRGLLAEVGGPTTVDEIAVPNEIVIRSLNEAYHLRDRCTGLLLLNAAKEDSTIF